MLLIQMVMLFIGVLMIAMPRTCTRKELRGDACAEKSIRTRGIWIFLAAMIWIVTEIIF